MNLMIEVATPNAPHLAKLEWPKYAVCRPELGDFLRATTGERASVVGVTHAMTKHNSPVLLVEVFAEKPIASTKTGDKEGQSGTLAGGAVVSN